MNWRRAFALTAFGLLAAYIGGRLAGSASGDRALAAGGGTGSPADGLVTVTTGAPGEDSNRLVLVDTSKKKILVYRVEPTYSRLIAVRTYDFDLQVAPTKDAANKGFDYPAIKASVLALQKRNPNAVRKINGREMVLTTQGEARNGNRLVLVNREMKVFLVYRLDGNSISLISARPYDYDQRLIFTKPLRKGLTYEQVKKMVDKADEGYADRGGRRR